MTTTKTTKKFMDGVPYEAADLGSGIHTALRKCCDGTLPSMLHSLISGSGDEWLLFLSAIKKAITDDKVIDVSSKASMAMTMGKWLCSDVPYEKDPTSVLTREGWQEQERKDFGRTRARFYAIQLGFRMLEEEEGLEGALEFLFYGQE